MQPTNPKITQEFTITDGPLAHSHQAETHVVTNHSIDPHHKPSSTETRLLKNCQLPIASPHMLDEIPSGEVSPIKSQSLLHLLQAVTTTVSLKSSLHCCWSCSLLLVCSAKRPPFTLHCRKLHQRIISPLLDLCHLIVAWTNTHNEDVHYHHWSLPWLSLRINFHLRAMQF